MPSRIATHLVMDFRISFFSRSVATTTQRCFVFHRRAVPIITTKTNSPVAASTGVDPLFTTTHRIPGIFPAAANITMIFFEWNHQRWRSSGTVRTFILLLSFLCGRHLEMTYAMVPPATTTTTTTMTTKTQQPLPAMMILPSNLAEKTVPQLRHTIEEMGLPTKGISKARKQELIEIILESHNNNNNSQTSTSDSSISAMNQSPTKPPPPSIEESKDIHQTSSAISQAVSEELNLPSAVALNIDSKLLSLIPSRIQANIASRGITSLLPIQAASFQRILEGRDTVLQAPTGHGKTLAFCLPLLSKGASSVNRGTPKAGIATPQVLVICPSRELARQVGKELERFSPTNSKRSVATVFGGVPLERHVSLLKYKPQYLVSTPGRLRELTREGHLSLERVTTLVLDEADSLLDAGDSPDVQAILRELEDAVGERDENPEYQLVLVSATIDDNVRDFTKSLEISPRAYITSENLATSQNSVSTMTTNKEQPQKQDPPSSAISRVPTVEHWHMSCKSMVRPSVTADLISILNPRMAIVFVPTKSDTESVANFLSGKLNQKHIVRTLHGDMTQSARSRTIAQIRDAVASSPSSSSVSQVLIATDVASRGLDLPNVELVVQFGIPRLAGKDNTFNSELYIHRTGRAGRVQANQRANGLRTSANAILLYDPAVGEANQLTHLVVEVQRNLGKTIRPKSIPSSLDIVNAGYSRAVETIEMSHHHDDDQSNAAELLSFVRSKLEDDMDTSDPTKLKDALARALMTIANLDSSINPNQAHASLLSGDPHMRTVRVSKKDTSDATTTAPLTPPDVTAFCKELGSGKLGRVTICADGSSAVFDLTPKKAKRLVDAVAHIVDSEWSLDLPLALPEL